MRECPFCAKRIRDNAIKCRYCKEFLPPKTEEETDFALYRRDATAVLKQLEKLDASVSAGVNRNQYRKKLGAACVHVANFVNCHVVGDATKYDSAREIYQSAQFYTQAQDRWDSLQELEQAIAEGKKTIRGLRTGLAMVLFSSNLQRRVNECIANLPQAQQAVRSSWDNARRATAQAQFLISQQR